MAGSLIRIQAKTDFVATAVGTTPMEVPLGDFDTRIFTSLALIGRIHAKSASTGSTQTANLYFRNLAPSLDDIVADFVAATAICTATWTMNGGTTGVQIPQIVAPAAGTVISYRVRLILAYSQSTAGTVFTFSLSADGLGRE